MRILLTLIAALFVFVSCGDIATETKEETEAAKVEKKAMPEVQLNDGERWEANAATVQGVENLMEMVESFDPSMQSYDTLQSELREEFGLIIRNCTMKGEAHEQLHNYLLPLMDLFGKLTQEDGQEALSAVETHLARFDTYFVSES